MILLMGPPTSGRTTLAEHLFPNHAKMNSSTKLPGQSPFAQLKSLFDTHGRVLVDKTHGSVKNRAKVVKACISLGADVYAVWVTAPLRACLAVRITRNHWSGGAVEHMKVPAYSEYAEEFETPTLSEGFASITTIPWYVCLSYYAFPVFDMITCLCSVL